MDTKMEAEWEKVRREGGAQLGEAEWEKTQTLEAFMTQTFSVTKISEKTKRTRGWDMISPMAMRAHQVRRLTATFGITVLEIRALLENLLQPHIMTRDRKRSVHIASSGSPRLDPPAAHGGNYAKLNKQQSCKQTRIHQRQALGPVASCKRQVVGCLLATGISLQPQAGNPFLKAGQFFGDPEICGPK
ncbi:GM16663 [Drosophila sechellia]|uniref:GM16663 n=1 Tax=Drosophila sechellia TaxID=7238 RepID=B4ICX9_DROSE|nr:GM16663 [Drosophila sechellia]